MKKFSFLFLLLFSAATIAFGQWSLIPATGIDSANVLKISFATSTDGVIIAEHTGTGIREIYHTTDGGSNWIPMSHAAISGTDFQDIFLTGSICYLASRNISSGGMRVFKTANFGTGWMNVSADTSNLGYGEASLFFNNPMNGWFGTGSSFYKTTNGGTNWTAFSTGSWGPKDIEFSDVNHGMIGLWDGTFAYMGAILTTSDGGTTWDTLNLNFANSMVERVCNPAPGEGYTFGNVFTPNYFLRTDNGWMTYDSLDLPLLNAGAFEQPRAMDFLPGGHGWLGSTFGRILYSADSGSTWVEERAPDTLQINEMQIAGNRVYAASGNGRIYKRDILLGRGNEMNRNALSVFPNPVTSGGNLQISGMDYPSEIVIRDISGRMIFKTEKQQDSDVISLPFLNAGMYLLEADGKFISKLIVQGN